MFRRAQSNDCELGSHDPTDKAGIEGGYSLTIARSSIQLRV